MASSQLQSWFIYTLEDPRYPGVIRYLGWTVDPGKRLQGHLAGAKSGRDKTRCGVWKRSLLREGLKPVLKIVETGSGEGWPAVEIRWIADLRNEGQPLLNHTEGGEGFRGRHSEETKSRMSAVAKGRPKPPRGEEHVKNLAAALKARQYTPELRAKMREAHLGQQVPQERRTRTSATMKAMLAANPDLATRRGDVLRARMAQPKARAEKSAELKAFWSDPIRRAERIAAQKAGHARKRSTGQPS